ncbi:MAG: hypothetical protein PUP91_22995 [Rhizonema sp. PD37]|nr:hypothetical protein [Rhizonema sp. PD37]
MLQYGEYVVVILDEQGKTTDCTRGANLREILLQNGIDLYNGDAKVVNTPG